MAPRGLSAEEKRVKLVEIFHETKDFFQLKELEKLGPKMKGIVSQTVKEVLQSLVDDGLVQTDKVGSSNFFWSYPSQRGTIVQNRYSTAEATRDAATNQLAELRVLIEEEKAARPDSAERTADLMLVADLKKKIASMNSEVSAYGACDPVKIAEKRRALELAKEAALRWTDNYSIALSWITQQTGADPDDIRKYLEIDGEPDYEDLVIS